MRCGSSPRSALASAPPDTAQILDTIRVDVVDVLVGAQDVTSTFIVSWVAHAAMAVATGQCSTAVAWRARKRASKGSRPWANVAQRIEGFQAWSRPFGLLRPVDEIAMLTRRYMHEYGATREHLANVAVAFRKHANRNPRAMMQAKELNTCRLAMSLLL